jgi:putative CocE/NonD family hydrolase
MDLHVPDADGWAAQPRPVLLEYLPYRKDEVAPYSGAQHLLAQHGYIGARLDCRGTGSSEGVTTDEYVEREQQDGAEAVEWIARQPWCTGKVGMFGKSYGGFTALQVAALQPPHLAAIVPVYFTDDRYTDDCHYRGGCLRGYYDVGHYGAYMVGLNALPPYPEWSQEDWARLWEEHLTQNEPYFLEWLGHQTDGEYWRNGSLRGSYDRIRCPVLLIGGWRDGYPNPPLRTFAQLRVPKKVLIGPWNHSWPDQAIPGPRVDWVAELRRWCDHWLKGEANGAADDPPITFYVQAYDDPRADRLETSGSWRVARDFPLPGASEQVLHLRAAGALAADTPQPGGSTESAASYSEAAGEAFDAFEYRPTVGIAGGLWSGGVPFGLPTDQRPDELHALTYTTAPLEVPLEIVGWPRAVLHVRSTAPVMAFVARLCDVAPDGTSALVTTGVLNGTRRASLTRPEPMDPEQTYELDIELDCTAWRFAPGHRVRLAVSSADFPNLWPTPFPGANRVHRGAGTPSRLLLPVVPSRQPDDEAAPTPAVAPVSPYRLGPDERPWELAHDVLGDRTGLRTVTRDVRRPTPTAELTTEARLSMWASNRDPADVVATGEHRRRFVRAGGTITVDTGCTLRSTASAFHLTIDLDVKVDGRPHHQRRWVRSYPRVLL